MTSWTTSVRTDPKTIKKLRDLVIADLLRKLNQTVAKIDDMIETVTSGASIDEGTVRNMFKDNEYLIDATSNLVNDVRTNSVMYVEHPRKELTHVHARQSS